jgi:hypothetical protein
MRELPLLPQVEQQPAQHGDVLQAQHHFNDVCVALQAANVACGKIACLGELSAFSHATEHKWAAQQALL